MYTTIGDQRKSEVAAKFVLDCEGANDGWTVHSFFKKPNLHGF